MTKVKRKGSLTYKRESLESVRYEVDDLFQRHWEDIALNKDKIKLNPDWSFYENLYSSGNLGIYTARSNGELVGYFVVVAAPHPHYKDHYFATNDIVFIHPDYRRGLAGYKLIKFAEEDLKKNGVSVLVINTKAHAPFDTLLQRMKFTLTERVYSKYLGE
jgi:GNAT superfamily N-acetyltransferase